MSLFGLHPTETLARNKAQGEAPHLPSLGESVRRGTIGFTLLGVAGFLPWAAGLGRTFGEGGMYLLCALVFVGLSGPLLHRLIIGPGSLRRFYALFGVAFTLYAILWCACWFGLRGRGRDYLGIILGMFAFGGVVAWAFAAKNRLLQIALALIVFHAAGYFLGGLAYAELKAAGGDWLGNLQRATRNMLAALAWGLGYGVGFGAGLGLAFHIAQAELRRALQQTSPP